MKMCPACLEWISQPASRCRYCGEVQACPPLERAGVEQASQRINRFLSQRQVEAAAREAHGLRSQIVRAPNAEEFAAELQQLDKVIEKLGKPHTIPARDPSLLWLKALVAVSLLNLAMPFLQLSPPPKPKPVQWEYSIESISDFSFDVEMANAGKAGWELVFARRASDSSDRMHYEAIFKRPLQPREDKS